MERRGNHTRWLRITAVIALFVGTVGVCAASPVLRVLRAGGGGSELISNGGFEVIGGKSPSGWQAWRNGFTVSGDAHGGTRSVACRNDMATGEYGASQHFQLDRTQASPLVISGWSKAEKVSGGPDSGYSLYVDITYVDGRELWGRTGSFRCGTHGWEQTQFIITPEKPIKSLTLYCLFRGHTGSVWFDDISMRETTASAGYFLFQGVPAQAVPYRPIASSKPSELSTRDGLSLALAGDGIRSLKAGGRELAAEGVSGFIVRDVASDSDFHGLTGRTVAKGDSAVTGSYDAGDLNLRLTADYQARADSISVKGKVTDTTGKDRAITLCFALPVDASGWTWGDDIRTSRTIAGTREYSNEVQIGCGSTGTMAQYPLGAIHDDRTGVAVAVDMGKPAQWRICYHPGIKSLVLAYDFGLVKDSERFPSSAEFSFVVYHFDPKWGFRSAYGKLQTIYPSWFTVRSKDQGIWMPFTNVSSVQGWEDFGFKYHEGDSDLPWDAAHGILAFRYSEPMTWWVPLDKTVPRTVEEARRAVDRLRATGNASQKQMAQALDTSMMLDPDANPYLRFIDAPWTDGAVWGLNPNPYLPGEVTEAKVIWNAGVKKERYGPAAKTTQAGEYLDSIEGYVTADLNYRRGHFRYTTVPLTFDSMTKQPALFKGFAVFELTKWMSDDLHGMGKLTFANGVPYRFTYLTPWLDVMGTETNWLWEGKYRPATDATMNVWRTLSGAKPYLLLMNTDFNAFTPDLVERYFQRALFYGMYPSMFSADAASNPYWQNPALYNRDRPLFRKYVPVIRKVAESGWQPITFARSDNPAIHVERFGPDAGGQVYLTLLNDSSSPQTGGLTIDSTSLGLKDSVSAQEPLSGRRMTVDGAGLHVDLKSQEAWVLELIAK